ncbi:hypothetical protein Tco_0247931 [Tanacetum coccineum]
MTPTIPKSQGLETSESLLQISKKPKSKKAPKETKETPPPEPTEESEQSYSVFLGKTPDPKDPERNKQLAGMGLPSTSLDEGTRKSKLLPEGTKSDLKDSVGNIQPIDTGLSSTVLKGNKAPADMELIYPYVADLSGSGDEYQVNETQSTRLSDDEVFKAGEYMDEDPQEPLNKTTPPQSTEEQYHSPPRDKPELSNALDTEFESSNLDVLQKYDNIKILTKRQTFDFASLKITMEALHDISNKKDAKLVNWAKSSTNMAWNMGSRLSKLELSHTALKTDISAIKQDISDIKSMMVEIFNAFKGQPFPTLTSSVTLTLALTHILANVKGENEANTSTEDPPSHTKGETDVMDTKNKQEQLDEPKQSTDANIEFIGSSIPHPSETLAHMDKEDQIKRAEEEAKLFEMNKPDVEKARRSLELRKSKYKNYMWTIINRLEPKKITNTKIHPNTKPVVVTVFRGTDGRTFDVHNPFAFGNFGIFELDELGEIIPKKKNAVVKDLMNSLSRRYERIKKIPKELGLMSALHASIHEKASSKPSRRMRKHMELEPEIKLPGLEYN